MFQTTRPVCVSEKKQKTISSNCNPHFDPKGIRPIISTRSNSPKKQIMGMEHINDLFGKLIYVKIGQVTYHFNGLRTLINFPPKLCYYCYLYLQGASKCKYSLLLHIILLHVLRTWKNVQFLSKAILIYLFTIYKIGLQSQLSSIYK